MGSSASAWAIAAIAAGGVSAARPAAAADEIIRPCRPGTPAHTSAGKALDALDAEIRKLAPAADPGPLAKRLEALGEGACFRIAGGLSVDAKSGLALRTWWEDGGHAAAAGALQLGGKDPIVWVAPDVRRALTRETAPEHRLAPLLCPASDDACGRDTDGWRLRAATAFEHGARIRHLQSVIPRLGSWSSARPPSDTDCGAFAIKAPRRRQLARYRFCLDTTALRVPSFAIGRVKKPIEGWLIVAGRRGHHSFCDEMRAFDLATGSTYRVASCSRLALASGGSVDHRATDAARKVERERGTVSLDEIREVAWMLLQLGELDASVLTGGFGRQLPRAIPLESDGQSESIIGLGSLSTSSGNTTLIWRIPGGDRALGGGTITWPRDLNDDTKAYAAELLEVAEASFRAGCPPATPSFTPFADLEGLSAHKLDTDTASLRRASSSLGDGWRELVSERCARR